MSRTFTLFQTICGSHIMWWNLHITNSSNTRTHSIKKKIEEKKSFSASEYNTRRNDDDENDERRKFARSFVCTCLLECIYWVMLNTKCAVIYLELNYIISHFFSFFFIFPIRLQLSLKYIFNVAIYGEKPMTINSAFTLLD